MFKKRNVRTENAAAIPAGIPKVPQTVINQAPNEALVYVVKAVVAGIGLFIGWHFLLYLLEEMRVKNPAQAVGYFLFGGISLIVVSIAVDKVYSKHAAMKREFLLQLKELDNQALHYKALAGQASVPTPANLIQEDKRFIRVVKQVLLTAYEHGPYKPKEVRPWSRDVAKKTRLIWDGKDIGWSDAVRLGEYLATNEIIVSGQLNTEKYPTMDAVNDLLDRDFTRSILIAPSPTVNGASK